MLSFNNKIYLRILAGILLLAVTLPLSAREINVRGTVTNLDDEPLYRVSIYNAATNKLVGVTNEDGKYLFTTKGIANEVADPVVEGNQVYGIVVYRPYLLSFLSHILNNSYGLYFLIIVPLAFLILLEILDRIKDKETENEREN